MIEIPDEVGIKDFFTVKVQRPISPQDVADAVKDALSEYAEREQADRSTERRTDRRLAIWLAILGFFGGALVTVAVSWIFAAIAGAL
ncbi:hypothetical protein BK819_01530 [Microbacterium sp. LCT-H2]|nr:hypothetical protein BK819_01530 [Microbacterium sp. LCT-H2]